MRPADSATPAAVTGAAVAAFDADIAKAVEERVVPWSRVERGPVTDTDDDDLDDDQGELTIGQLGVTHGSDMSNATPVSWVSTHEKSTHEKVR